MSQPKSTQILLSPRALYPEYTWAEFNVKIRGNYRGSLRGVEVVPALDDLPVADRQLEAGRQRTLPSGEAAEADLLMMYRFDHTDRSTTAGARYQVEDGARKYIEQGVVLLDVADGQIVGGGEMYKVLRGRDGKRRHAPYTRAATSSCDVAPMSEVDPEREIRRLRLMNAIAETIFGEPLRQGPEEATATAEAWVALREQCEVVPILGSAGERFMFTPAA
jgi:hypothetical protein